MKLVNYLAFSNESTARAFEDYLKSEPGRAFAIKHFWPSEQQNETLPAAEVAKVVPFPSCDEEASEKTSLQPVSISQETLGWIAMWMDSDNHLEDAFLDVETGETYIGADELRAECGSEVDLDEDDRFVYLEPIDSHDGYRIMETFTRSADIPESKRDKLFQALDGPKPFRRFRDIVFPDEQLSPLFEDHKVEYITGILESIIESRGYKLTRSQ